jgi:hypothetical protein
MPTVRRQLIGDTGLGQVIWFFRISWHILMQPRSLTARMDWIVQVIPTYFGSIPHLLTPETWYVPDFPIPDDRDFRQDHPATQPDAMTPAADWQRASSPPRCGVTAGLAAP